MTNIDEARQLLKKSGYFVDNLWHINDVKERYICTDEQAYEVLSNALTKGNTMEDIWLAIDIQSSSNNLKEIK
jgi:hypothetical protein